MRTSAPRPCPSSKQLLRSPESCRTGDPAALGVVPHAGLDARAERLRHVEEEALARRRRGLANDVVCGLRSEIAGLLGDGAAERLGHDNYFVFGGSVDAAGC